MESPPSPTNTREPWGRGWRPGNCLVLGDGVGGGGDLSHEEASTREGRGFSPGAPGALQVTPIPSADEETTAAEDGGSRKVSRGDSGEDDESVGPEPRSLLPPPGLPIGQALHLREPRLRPLSTPTQHCYLLYGKLFLCSIPYLVAGAEKAWV